jgi:hypothetical protein
MNSSSQENPREKSNQNESGITNKTVRPKGSRKASAKSAKPGGKKEVAELSETKKFTFIKKMLFHEPPKRKKK